MQLCAGAHGGRFYQRMVNSTPPPPPARRRGSAWPKSAGAGRGPRSVSAPLTGNGSTPTRPRRACRAVPFGLTWGAAGSPRQSHMLDIRNTCMWPPSVPVATRHARCGVAGRPLHSEDPDGAARRTRLAPPAPGRALKSIAACHRRARTIQPVRAHSFRSGLRPPPLLRGHATDL